MHFPRLVQNPFDILHQFLIHASFQQDKKCPKFDKYLFSNEENTSRIFLKEDDIYTEYCKSSAHEALYKHDFFDRIMFRTTGNALTSYILIVLLYVRLCYRCCCAM